MIDYESIHLHLSTDEDSPRFTDEDVDALIEFCREELEPTGEFILHKFEEGES